MEKENIEIVVDGVIYESFDVEDDDCENCELFEKCHDNELNSVDINRCNCYEKIGENKNFRKKEVVSKEETKKNLAELNEKNMNCVIEPVLPISTEEKLNSHYDNYFKGERLDPYRVSDIWRLGTRDNTGVLFHILKTIARFGDKNSIEREIKSIYFSIKRLAEIRGIDLKEK